MNRIERVLRAHLSRRDVLGMAGKLLLSAALVLLLGAQATVATTIIGPGNFSGTDVDFLGVQETSTALLGPGSAKPEPLFGSGLTAPVVFGNSLVLFPTTFSASSSGGGTDGTGSQLQATIMATGAPTIDTILISEFGDSDLSGVGTGATGTFASLAGIITVLETVGGVPCVGPICQIGFVGTFTPTDTLGLPVDSGLTLWSGDASIDVASVVPNATKVFLSLDNDLYASSEANTAALIQKKVGGPFTITVVPEPTTMLMLSGGLLAVVAGARRRRR